MWTVNRHATEAGVPTEELEDDERKAMVNVTPMPDGTFVVSLSLVLRPLNVDGAKAYAERLLREHLDVAVPK